MAKFSSIIRFTGSLGGELTGSNYKGIAVLRKKPVTSSQPNTQKQLEQRMRLKLVGTALKDVAPYLRTSFAEACSGATSGYTAGVSCNLKNDSIVGIYPDLLVDYSQLQVAKGTLLAEEQVTASRFDDRFELAWTDNSGNGNAVATDVAMPVVYNKTKNVWLYATEGANRASKRMIVPIPQAWKTDDVEVWVSFRSENGKKNSDSVYVQVA